ATYYYNMAAMFEKSTEDVSAKYASAGGYPFWDGNYTVFGQVFEGLDVLDKISAAEVT
ncbi:MAG TPA: peptidylprolyl isomerase, partial [Ruminococcaceae bacterium]|nr:peptidylprolyl isomerase [Oscillospiraceae bacterium]